MSNSNTVRQTLAAFWFGVVAVVLMVQLQAASIDMLVDDHCCDLAEQLDLTPEEEEKKEKEEEQQEKELDDLFHHHFTVAVPASGQLSDLLHVHARWKAPLLVILQPPPEWIPALA